MHATATEQSDHCADELDRASIAQQREMEYKLANHASRNIRQLHPDFDGEHCVECDDQIHPDRIALVKYEIHHLKNRHPHITDSVNGSMITKHGTDKCVACASAADHRSKMFAALQ